MHDADGHLDGGGDLADGLAFGAACEDHAPLVVVHNGASAADPAADPAAGAGGVEAVLRLLHDVAAPVLGEREREVQDQGAFGVLAGGIVVQDLDGDAALEEVVG